VAKAKVPPKRRAAKGEYAVSDEESESDEDEDEDEDEGEDEGEVEDVSESEGDEEYGSDAGWGSDDDDEASSGGEREAKVPPASAAAAGDGGAREIAPGIVECSMCQQAMLRNELAAHESLCAKREALASQDEKLAIQLGREEMPLTDAQKAALKYVQERSRKLHRKALRTLVPRVLKLGYTEKDLKQTLRYIRNDAQLIIHLHPDRVLHFLLKDTHYRNQFETGTGSGALRCACTASRVAWVIASLSPVSRAAACPCACPGRIASSIAPTATPRRTAQSASSTAYSTWCATPRAWRAVACTATRTCGCARTVCG
jgi:endogenous inhibitor of DNA gyrase (YacG/DUF329 family)